MTFASTIIGKTTFGNKEASWGTFTNASGDTGGNINTGIMTVTRMELTIKGAAVVAANPSVNETMPCDGTAVTIVTGDDEDGYWYAEGYGKGPGA